MGILKFKRKVTLKQKIILILIFILMILIIGTIITYRVNEDVREWINVNILKKDVTEDDVATININSDRIQLIYAYDKYITILSNGSLEIYNNYAHKVGEIDIQISDPMFESNGSYLSIAEKNGQRVYLISDGKVLWENKVEGNIRGIRVNKSGNIAVLTNGTSYKSVIVTYDKSGKELFKTYLASTIAVAADISADGKYLAIAEVNIGGAVVESSVKIIEIENAKDGVIYKYNAEPNKIITDIKYQEKGGLVCKYDDSIHVINNDTDSELKTLESVQIADINLSGNVVTVEANTDVILTNVVNNSEITYTSESAIKEIICNEQTIAINLGTEVHFIGVNGWLTKRYSSIHEKEIKEITLGSSIAGIIYRDRIKVIAI